MIASLNAGMEETAMLADYVTYALYGLGGAIGFDAVCWVMIRYEQGRRRANDQMTPEERREAKVFQSVFRRR